MVESTPIKPQEAEQLQIMYIKQSRLGGHLCIKLWLMMYVTQLVASSLSCKPMQTFYLYIIKPLQSDNGLLETVVMLMEKILCS